VGRRLLVTLLAACAAVPAAPAVAEPAGAGHPDWSCCAAIAEFPKDFPVLLDADWGYPIGGWGGIRRRAPLARTPVIFVHGNGEDASFWDLDNETSVAVNVRARFRAAGYSDQELWALSYNGQRCGSNLCQTYNQINVADFAAFMRVVLDYTGARTVDVVAHSLGVTVVRRALYEQPDLVAHVEDAIFASGANHGTTTCRGSGSIKGCDEMEPGSAWLAELNADETPGAIRFVTICDCTGVADHFFLAVDARSPQLDGAENLEIPGSLHFMTARGPDAFSRFLPLVRRKARRSEVLGFHASRIPGATLPATGLRAASVGWVLLGAAGLIVAGMLLGKAWRLKR